ncbi:MAG: hypothetical protein O2894_08910, partial [Planctomycetota bacterium]|nr:hypothetical protein [Planctomycetota bacterium]
MLRTTSWLLLLLILTPGAVCADEGPLDGDALVRALCSPVAQERERALEHAVARGADVYPA